MDVRRSVGVAAGAILAACATAPEKQEAAPAVQDFDAVQIVRIDTVGPAGGVSARCGVKNDRGNSEILAPGVAEVIRSARPLEVLCFAPGYRIAMRSLESSGDVIGPAATGVVTGGAVGAVAALPLLAVPVFGVLMYAGVVGGGALLGGAVNAADKHSKGKIYSYPPSAVIAMVPESSLPSDALGGARPLTATEPVPQPSLAAMSAAPMPMVAPMTQPALAAAPPATPVFKVATAPAVAPMLPISHEVPAFPPEAAQAGLTEGKVRAQLVIDAEGNVSSVRIVEARPEKLFDRAVTETLTRWKFARGDPGRQFDAEIEFRR